MLENIKPNNENLAKELSSIDENQTRKRLAPLTPAITSIDQRINMLEKKGRKRGKRNSWIGILTSLLILIVVFFLGYFLLTEIDRIADKVDVDENMIINSESDPDNLGPADDSCCLTSLSRLKKNGYMTIDELGVCPNGLVANKLKCATSLSWCEPLEADVPVDGSAEIDKTDIDTSNWKSYKNSEYGFYFSLPQDVYILPEEDVDGSGIKRIYVKKSATSSEFYLSLKVISPTGASSTEAYVDEQKRVLESLASTSGMSADLASREYRTDNLLGKKIIVTSEYEGSETVSEEVIFAGNGYIFAIAYPNFSSRVASSSQTEITRAIIITFNFASLIKENSEESASQPVAETVNDSPQEEKSGSDDDGDGLNESDEKKYGTDPKKADTDGDGFSDGDEVKNGYNPAGQGML